MNSIATDLARLGEVAFRAPERIWIVAPVLLVLLLAPLMRWRRGTTAPSATLAPLDSDSLSKKGTRTAGRCSAYAGSNQRIRSGSGRTKNNQG